MLIKTTTVLNGSSCATTIDEVTKCPMCNHAIKPVQLHGYAYTRNSVHYHISIHYLCQACDNTFIVKYQNATYSSTTGLFGKEISHIAPIEFVPSTFENIINDISPSFISIYGQAEAAEHYGLNDISGIGYRKALEFLIKDFLIKKTPDKEDSIKKSQLGSCITNFIDNPQLMTAASRAVWLGNDQTHYIQKFEDKDVSDLKKLIRLTVHWISMIIETEQAELIVPIK